MSVIDHVELAIEERDEFLRVSGAAPPGISRTASAETPEEALRRPRPRSGPRASC